MTRLQSMLLDRRVWRIAALVLTLVLVACQQNDGGGGVEPPGY